MNNIGESEGFGSSSRADSEDSFFPKRKSISLNMDRCDNMDIPLQVISLSKMSSLERRDLELRLRAELEQIQIFQKKILSSGADVVAVSSSTNGQQVKKRPPSSQAAPQVKSTVVNKYGMPKHAPAHVMGSTTSNSNAMLMKQCEALLKRLMSHQYSWVFNTPVDVVKLNIPDYYSIIKHPMDLGTVKSKIASGAYVNPWGFLADVRLTFKNAMTYNPPGNDVHYMADTLNKFFEVRWKSIEKKLSAPDSVITREKDAKLVPLSKKRKVPPASIPTLPQKGLDNNLKRMADEERHTLTRRLDALIAELPMNIIDFLKKHSNNGNQTCDDEIEIDMDALSDDTVFELKRLLDDYLGDKKSTQQSKDPSLEIEILNASGLSSSSLQPCKVNGPVEEDVDIGGNDLPIPNYPPVEIEKDVTGTNKCSSSSSSSSELRSSSSDSDSAASSGSESEVEKAPSSKSAAKVKMLQEALMDQEKSDVMNPADGNYIPGRSDSQPEQNGHSKTTSFVDNGCQQGENAPSERQVSPDKLYRAALLRSRFADTILKAREKAPDKADKVDLEKLRREREELERLQREEKARLQAEARAAEEARKLKQAEAAAEAKRKRELEREAARQALLQMEKTVEINENSQFLKDLEMLRREPVEQLPSSVDETSPDLSQDGLGSFRLRGSNPLEQLGLFMKADEEEEEDIELNHLPRNDVEEGEID